MSTDMENGKGKQRHFGMIINISKSMASASVNYTR
jgi:hypothetical protein